MATDDRTVNGVRQKDKRKVVIDWECVNSECRVVGTKPHNMINGGQAQVKTATNYVIAFYGQGPKQTEMGVQQEEGVLKKRKVCFPCEGKAIEAQERMIENLLTGDSIMKDKLFPTPRDVVLIEDSSLSLVANRARRTTSSLLIWLLPS